MRFSITFSFLLAALAVYAGNIRYPSDCLEDMPDLMAVTGGKGCSCATRGDPNPGGNVCPSPKNAKPICIVDKTKCDFECDPGYEKTEDLLSCIKKTGGGTTTPVTPVEPKPFKCAAHQPIAYARPGKRCACFEDEDYATASDIKCPNPTTGNGKPGCQNLGTTNSECWVQCDDEYKASADGKTCEPTATEQIVKPSLCADSDEQYLTADPVLGCVCKAGPSDKWCKKPANGKITCYQNADKSIVECRAADCLASFQPKGDKCESSIPPPIVQKLSECTPGGAQLWVHPADGCVCASKRLAGSTGCYRPGGDGDAVCKSDGYKKDAQCEKVCDDGKPMDAKGDCSEAA